MIDSEGYRPNVGIILCNAEGRLFWAKRIGQRSWQFPQGGIQRDESPEQAMFRELAEEVGLRPEHVQVIGCTRGWLRYRLPKRLVREGSGRPTCIGQKQIWFLLRMLGSEDAVRLDLSDRPEFDHWQWVDYWYPLRAVVAFKRYVYWRALHELAPLLIPVRPSKRTSMARMDKGGLRRTQSNHQGSGLKRSPAPIIPRDVAVEIAIARPSPAAQSTPTAKSTTVAPLRWVETRQHPVITRMVVSARRLSVLDSESAAPTLESATAVVDLDEVRPPPPAVSNPHRVSRR